MNWLKSLASLAAAAATIFVPQLQVLVAAHPAIVSGIWSVFAIWAHISPSPTGAAVVTSTGEKGTAVAVE